VNSRLKLAHHRVICCICNTGSGSADKALGIVIFRRIINTFGFAFISAGALGNSLDRLRLGAVVDASKLRFVWVFNVADVSIDF
jgi:signal peptidase II